MNIFDKGNCKQPEDPRPEEEVAIAKSEQLIIKKKRNLKIYSTKKEEALCH